MATDDHVLPQSGIAYDRVAGQRGERATPGQPPISLSSPPRFVPPRPDWRQEQLDAEARDRELALRAPVRAVEPPLVEEDERTEPAKPKPRTPNLDRWKREMLIADRGDAA